MEGPRGDTIQGDKGKGGWNGPSNEASTGNDLEEDDTKAGNLGLEIGTAGGTTTEGEAIIANGGIRNGTQAVRENSFR